MLVEHDPTMPLGYFGLAWIAVVPPIWRAIIDIGGVGRLRREFANRTAAARPSVRRCRRRLTVQTACEHLSFQKVDPWAPCAAAANALARTDSSTMLMTVAWRMTIMPLSMRAGEARCE